MGLHYVSHPLNFLKNAFRLKSNNQKYLNKLHLHCFENQKVCTSRQIHNLNVSDYLSRINYKGSVEPSLETLKGLSQMHKSSVPYTNVEFINGTRKILDIDILYQRIVKDRGGGVCHEINGLFTWLLRELGFEVHLYSAQFFIDRTKEWSEWAGHSFPFVNFGEEGMYLVDPGYQLTGPMKFELLAPHSEIHGIYRFRKIPGTTKDFYLERRRKTTYNSKGEVVKQGPAPEDVSRHWKATHTFHAEPMDLDHFQAGMDKRQTNREFTARNLILLRYYDGGYHTIFGRKYIHKLCPDPLTEIITDEVELTNDEQIHQMARDQFGYEVKDKLTIFERNLLD